MQQIYGLIFIALTLSHPGSSAAANAGLRFENMKGWTVEAVDSDPTLSALFEGSKYVLFIDDPDAEERPILRVREIGGADNLDSKKAASWQKAVFFDKSQSRIITAQNVFKKNKAHHYTAEFQTDTGTPTMLHSILHASVIDGRIHVIVYDQRREIFQKNVGKIKELFKNIIISADVARTAAGSAENKQSPQTGRPRPDMEK